MRPTSGTRQGRSDSRTELYLQGTTHSVTPSDDVDPARLALPLYQGAWAGSGSVMLVADC
jgi:hypothetical protein